MLTTHITNNLQRVSLTYLPAQYHHSTCMVDYYICDPVSGKKLRKQIRLLRVKNRTTEREFQRYVTDLIYNINNRLASGWNPLHESSNAKHYTPFADAIEIFVEEKIKECRPDTMRSYKGVSTALVRFTSKFYPTLLVGAFTNKIAMEFLEHIYSTRKISARSYNNYLKTSKVIFGFFKDHFYCPINPFEEIKIKRSEEKKRGILSDATRSLLYEYLSENNKMFLLVCYLVYYSLIRPKEIRCLKVQDIRLAEKCIVIRSEVAKNHKERYAALTTEVIHLILDLGILNHPATHYVVGNNFESGTEKLPDNAMSKFWDKLRRKLRLPADAQLYSLRDTAIFENLKAGIDPLTIQQHADHHSLRMTDIYAKHKDTELIDKMFHQPISFVHK